MEEVTKCDRCNKPKEGDDACKCGRPTKMTDRWLKAGEEVLGSGDDVIILTDDELRVEINSRLEEEEQIGQSTFELWKSEALDGRADGNYKQFLGLIKKALNREKKELFKKLREDEKAWQRWAWIIERKFDEWNIKRKLGIGTLPKDGAAALAGALIGEDDGDDSDS